MTASTPSQRLRKNSSAVRTHPHTLLALYSVVFLTSVPLGVCWTRDQPADERCGWEAPRPEELRAAVCVTGQVARLELQSKIEHLLIPNNRSARLDVYLLLQDGKKASFSQGLAGDDGTCRHSPSSLEEARQLLAKHARVYAYEQTREAEIQADPSKWPDLVAVNNAQRASLVRNHVYQLAAWKACGEAVKQREAEEVFKYHVILRLREASAVVLPFDLHTALVQSGYDEKNLTDDKYLTDETRLTDERVTSIEDCVPQPRVMTKACASWRGYPDKAMLIPRRYLEGALLGPLHEYIAVVGERSPATSVENYLKIVLDRHDIAVVMIKQPALMPITDTRCEKGSYCLVLPVKDCRPMIMAKSWTSCDRKYTMWERKRSSKKARRGGRAKVLANLKKKRSGG